MFRRFSTLAYLTKKWTSWTNWIRMLDHLRLTLTSFPGNRNCVHKNRLLGLVFSNIHWYIYFHIFSQGFSLLLRMLFCCTSMILISCKSHVLLCRLDAHPEFPFHIPFWKGDGWMVETSFNNTSFFYSTNKRIEWHLVLYSSLSL